MDNLLPIIESKEGLEEIKKIFEERWKAKFEDMKKDVQRERNRCELEVLRWRARNIVHPDHNNTTHLWHACGELAEVIRKGQTTR